MTSSFPGLNPSVWYLDAPPANSSNEDRNDPEQGNFEAFFAEYRVSDRNPSSGRKVKTIKIEGSTCLMRVEVYDYPKEMS